MMKFLFRIIKIVCVIWAIILILAALGFVSEWHMLSNSVQ